MSILLNGERDLDITIVSNHFIDHFMPRANGAYIKVYLYLLRRLHAPASAGPDLTVAGLADFLGDTEGDVLRAFAYWERHGLLQITRQNGEVTGLQLLECPPVPAEATAAEALSTTPGQSDAPAKTAAETTDSADSTAVTPDISGTSARTKLPTYTKKQIRELSQNDEIKWIMNVAERYLERLLNPADIQLIIYLYESIGFPADLILYLYEYCASKDKKNPSYIEAVAIRWAQEGIRSVADAESASTRYNTGYQTVAKAFGLNRMPGAAEQQFIDRWMGTGEGQFGFSAEIVTEACNRSLLATQRPDFKYADKILENWHKKGATDIAGIRRLDEQHNQAAARSAAVSGSRSGQTNGQAPRTNNRFNAFPQRNYTGEEFSSMEQRLLKRQGS